LLLIYRSPVAIFVPLITIGVSYLTARGIAGYMAASGTNVSSLVDAYLVVTLFGIGTDYCLFMVSRYKEELGLNHHRAAGQRALERIGPVILASATTVIVALLCLGISQFGMNRTSGFVLAIGVAITLLASLSLTPALISLFGQKLLWPAKLQRNKRETGHVWNRLGRQITRRPALLAVPIIVVLALPYIALPKINYTADMMSQMPQDIDSVQGYNTLRDHFSTGVLNPLEVVIEAPGTNLTDPSSGRPLATSPGP
jgi:putative drug exporter of the RND superfamily